MIEANQCEIGEKYEDISSGQVYEVKSYGEMKVFEYYDMPGNYTTALNEKFHRKKSV